MDSNVRKRVEHETYKAMDIIDWYQQHTDGTAVYPSAGTGAVHEYMYLALGLSSEAGEVSNQIKKMYRDDITVDDMHERLTGKIRSELGDVMWYVLRICRAANWNLMEILLETADKLDDRKDRGVIHGDGDKR